MNLQGESPCGKPVSPVSMSDPCRPRPARGQGASGRFGDQPAAVRTTASACVVGVMSIGLVDPIRTSIAAGRQPGGPPTGIAV